MSTDPGWLRRFEAAGMHPVGTIADRIDAPTQRETCKPRRKRTVSSVYSPMPLEWSVRFTVPVIVVSEANTPGHWSARHRRFQAQKRGVDAALLIQGLKAWSPPSWPVRVELTRSGGKTLDSDNLAGAFKGVQDAVAAWLKCDDGDAAKVTWHRTQEKDGPAGVTVTVWGSFPAAGS